MNFYFGTEFCFEIQCRRDWIYLNIGQHLYGYFIFKSCQCLYIAMEFNYTVLIFSYVQLRLVRFVTMWISENVVTCWNSIIYQFRKFNIEE